jgi:hypothetical protein
MQDKIHMQYRLTSFTHKGCLQVRAQPESDAGRKQDWQAEVQKLATKLVATQDALEALCIEKEIDCSTFCAVQ